MRDYILEACVDSVESAIAADLGGASRLELCSNLIIGGTTPSEGLFCEIRKALDIKIHVLIRPRFGDFCYTDYEFDLIKDAVREFYYLGADGVVIGILKPDGTLNVEQLAELMDEAEDMSVTLHRAFDLCVNPYEAMEQAIVLGMNTILTSGQENVCTQGAPLLKKLRELSRGRIVIQAAGGVNAETIKEIYPVTKIKAYHMSGRVTVNSEMEYRKEGINMGLPSINEYELWRTDVNKIRKARQALVAL